MPSRSEPVEAPSVWTIGHGGLSEADFLARLAEPGIDLVADVRAQPGSRRSPQFGGAAMAGWLGDNGVGYVRIPELAGRRRRQDVDPALNAGWRNASFHNYADHMQGEEFAEGLSALADLATEHRVAIMCGEPVPWRCHRMLIADALASRGSDVVHLMPDGHGRLHELGAWGAAPRLGADGGLTYPGGVEP